MAWAKLHTDILGDDKLLEAAADGAANLHWLPWLIAFAKRADDEGRISTNGRPARPAIIARLIPGATAESVEACLAELESIGVLIRCDDDVLGFAAWDDRSGAKPSDDASSVAERVKRHRERKRQSATRVNAEVKRVTETTCNAIEVEVDGEVDKREMESVTSPRPLANASTVTEPLDDPTPPRWSADYGRGVILPPPVAQFVNELYGLSTEQRRADVRRQLFDAIDPTKRGAFLRRGVYVKAKDADHLARVCTAVRLDPPQQLDSAIVYVLRKLQDAETDANGRTVTEAASFDQKQTDALLTRYEAAAKAAANAWVKANRDAYAAITARLGVQFPGATTDASADSWIRIAYDAAHLSEVRKASGFPDFETWRANLPNIAKVG